MAESTFPGEPYILAGGRWAIYVCVGGVVAVILLDGYEGFTGINTIAGISTTTLMLTVSALCVVDCMVSVFGGFTA